MLVSRIAAAAALISFVVAAHAQLTVQEPWVRATVAGQQASGLFAQLSSAAGGKLVAASSPLAGVAEIHEMALQGNVMRMRAVPFVELPAGKVVKLEPGGYHVMLLELKQPLAAGERVPVSLTFERADGQRETVEVQATVRALGAAHKMH